MDTIITTPRRASKPAKRRHKTDLDSICAQIRKAGFDLDLTSEDLLSINQCGLRSKNLALAIVATQIVRDERPITVRGVMYRLVSAGFLPSTDREHYTRVVR